MKGIFLSFFLFFIFNSNAQEKMRIPGTITFFDETNLGVISKIQDGNSSIATSFTQSACGLDFTYHSASLHQRSFTFGSSPNIQPYTFPISGIPNCAVIVKAFLYANFERAASMTSVNVNLTNPLNTSSVFPMTLIGSGPSVCWSGGNNASRTFRADVTNLISGNGNYVVNGLPVSSTGPDCNGFTIFIIWSDPTQNWTGHFIIADGSYPVLTGMASSTIGGFNVCGPTNSTRNFMVISDLQKVANTNLAFNSAISNSLLSTVTQSVWNYVESNINAQTPGQNTATFSIGPNNSDCFNLDIAGMYYRTSCNFCPSSAPTLTPNVLTAQTCSTTGSATVTAVTGDPGPFTYTWLPGPVTGSVITNLAPGTYTLLVSNVNGCKSGSATIQITQGVAQFSVGAPSNDYTLTCINNPITVTTTAVGSAPYNYTWTSGSYTLTGNAANISQPGIWTVIGQNTASGCFTTATFTVNQNLSSPTVAVSPTAVVVNCNTTTPVTFTGTSNMGPNVTTQWYYINGSSLVPVGVPQGTINIYSPGAPGMYVFTSTNNLTGCSSSFTVQANTSIGLPQFTVTSPTQFTIGCSPLNTTAIQVSSVITSPTVGVGVQYAMSPPGSTTAPVYGSVPTFSNLTVPGTYTIWVKDVTNQCVSSQQVSIIQNTIAPAVNYIFTPGILNLSCLNPSVILNGVSSNTNAQITWTVPTVSGSSVWPQANYTVFTNSSVPNASSQITSAGIFTVGALDPNNLCRSTKTVQILQDLRLPILTPTTSPQKLTCKDPDVVLINAQASHSMNAVLVTSYCWIPPQITFSVCNTQMNTGIPGVFTCIATSNLNGCSVVRTYTVVQDIVPPTILNVGQTFTADCSHTTPTTQICINVSSPTAGITFTWDVLPINATVSSLTSSCITVVNIGQFGCTITNTVNGCKTISYYEVLPGKITASLNANPMVSYPPSVVSFTNLSFTSTGNQSITSTWYFGNGTYSSNISNTIVPNTTYNNPGQYTVVLVVNKGSCVDTVTQIILIEMPSQLEVPNIFSPNGDGVNDVFRLIGSGLDYIHILIFDRWGTKIYETESTTGNLAWDGKNLQGKDCAPGVFFYILEAKGKDQKEYKKKGNVTLVR